MHFKYVAITFATYAVSNVFAAPVASDVTSLRVRAEEAPQAQNDAQLDATGNKNDQHMKQPEAKPAYVQNNMEQQSKKQQEGSVHPEDQMDETDMKPETAQHKNQGNPPPEHPQNTVGTTKDQNNDNLDENKNQVDDTQLDDTQDLQDTQNLQDTQMTSRPQTDRPMEGDTQTDDNQNMVAAPSYNQQPPTYNQGQGQGGHQVNPSNRPHRQQRPQQAPPSYYPGGARPYSVSPCDYHGEFLCNGPDLYGLCNWGQVIWQPVAAGTACVDGGIGYAWQ